MQISTPPIIGPVATRIRVELGGKTVADSTEAMMYRSSPYKGRARYWNATIAGEEHKDLIWAYPEPLQDAERIRDTVGLYHEKMTVFVDGEKLGQPPSHFTR